MEISGNIKLVTGKRIESTNHYCLNKLLAIDVVYRFKKKTLCFELLYTCSKALGIVLCDFMLRSMSTSVIMY